jgi:hypothetical protein
MASASFEQLEYYLGDNIYSESDDIGVKVARWINWNAAKGYTLGISASGTKRTSQLCCTMSAFGVKRTSNGQPPMSAYDPKRT